VVLMVSSHCRRIAVACQECQLAVARCDNRFRRLGGGRRSVRNFGASDEWV